MHTFAKSRTLTPTGPPEVFVGAFGKHPGWNDHIDDLGLETEPLLALKRVLYLEGIGAAVDAGAWDSLDESKRTEGFGHVMVCRRRSEIIACRMWSSSDGKGRTKYPMVVCVECRGATFAWVLSEVLPGLERAEAACTAAATADAVKARLEDVRRDLRERGARLPSAPSGPGERPAIATLADSPAMGPACQGLQRVMYQIERDMADFLPMAGDSGSRSRPAKPRPQHIRVPACGPTPALAASLWIRFMRQVLDPSAPVAAIVPLGQEWIDLIVGEPEGSQFFCIRASPGSIPPATQIPYTLDAAFVARCNARVERARADGAEEDDRATGGGAEPTKPRGVWGSVVAKLTGRGPKQVTL